MNFRTSTAALSVRVSVIGVVFCVVAIAILQSHANLERPVAPVNSPATWDRALMRLTLADWSIVALYFLFNVAVGLYYKRRASRDTAEFFLSARNVPWWLAGTSMVAAAVAADTPLAVTGLVAR